ncbi:MAG: SGNH hydrolase domain-containing protein [Acidimicrobiales bacterium]
MPFFEELEWYALLSTLSVQTERCRSRPARRPRRGVLLAVAVLEEVAQHYGYDFLLLAKASCPPVDETIGHNLNKTPNTECDRWRNQSISRINAFDPQIVIVTGNDFDPGNAEDRPMPQDVYSAGPLKTLEDISARGRRLEALGDISYLTTTGPVCLAANEGELQECTSVTPTAAPASHMLAQEDAANKADATYISTIPWLCTPTKCPAIIDDIDVYQDQFHITTVMCSTCSRSWRQLSSSTRPERLTAFACGDRGSSISS